MNEHHIGTIRNDDRSREHRSLLETACQRHGLDQRQTAYVLATAQHESRMGLWMVTDQTGLGDEGNYHLGNTRRGDGLRYRGRGYVRLRGRLQYALWSRRLGLPLLDHPEMAAEPLIAAEITVRGMADGTFTGVRLDEFIDAARCDYLGAREVVDGDVDRADLVARYARYFEDSTQPSDPGDVDRDAIIVAQRHLKRIGWPVVVDGIPGTFTKRAIADFKRGYTFDALIPDGRIDHATIEALSDCAANHGLASPHFRFDEFRTGGSTRLSRDNRVISIDRCIVHGLERYHERTRRRVIIASGYRSAAFNRQIRAAEDSRHVSGLAVDVLEPRLSVSQVIDLGAFSAIGARDGKAVHLEITPGGDPARPRVFQLFPWGLGK